MPQPKQKVLVIRNDKLGDFVLSFPAIRLLKQAIPELELHVLVPAYTRPIAEMNPDIDSVIEDPGAQQGWQGIKELVTRFRLERYAAVITLFSTTRTGLACWLSRIPVRIAPATKLAQVFYNHRVTQRRSRSEQPEHAYNSDLARYYLQLLHNQHTGELHGPYLVIPASTSAAVRAAFYQQHKLPVEHKLIFIHPGSGGSAVNLSVAQYAALANTIRCPSPHTFVISCAPPEETQARQLAALLAVPHTVYVSTEGLQRFVEHISLAALFISGSTGPLHVAGALDRPTAGFYPNRRSATPLRWQTINSDERRLAFSPPENAPAEDMSSIDIPEAATAISQMLARLTN